MISRINILDIVRDHFSSLRALDQKSRWIHRDDFIFFILFPAFVSGLLVYNNYGFGQQISNLIAGISIFGGFLFNLLAIIYGQFDKIKQDVDAESNVVKKRFLKEIHSNISFCIVLSIVIVLTLLLTTVDFIKFTNSGYLIRFIDGLAYFLMILFLLTLIMVLNRVYILLKKDIT